VVVDAERTRYQSPSCGGWRLVHASPEEQALLDAHGFRAEGSSNERWSLGGGAWYERGRSGWTCCRSACGRCTRRTAFLLVSLRAQLVWLHDQGKF
jgi:hypothetical protein